MTCATARTLLLTADPGELAGATGSDLALHIATCASCAARAALLLESQTELVRRLKVEPPHDAPEVVRSAIAAARRRAAVRRRGWTVPLAAAAGIAGLIGIHSGGRTPFPAAQPVAPRAPGGFSVIASPGRSVAVLHTDNPNVVIIWYLK